MQYVLIRLTPKKISYVNQQETESSPRDNENDEIN